MVRRKERTRLLRLAMLAAVGGSAFQLSGCDPAVRDTILTGVETTTATLANTLISAFFISLEDDDGTSDGLTTT
jgi:hypothetical protein